MKKCISNALKKFPVVQWLAAGILAGMAASPAIAQSTYFGSDACKDLIYQGLELQAKANMNDALARFQAAAKQCPDASSPLSHLGQLFLNVSDNTDPKYVEDYRKRAENYARAALAKNSQDPVALEVLRGLTDPHADMQHKPVPEAVQALRKAEVLFAARKLDEAYGAYMAAQKLDPEWAAPWIFAGDCLFDQNRMSEAEEHYRKGTQADPYFVQGWRFLADALLHQSKVDEARQALMNAIRVQPNYMPAWENLSSLNSRFDKPMTALKFSLKASASVDKKTGQSTINIDPAMASENGKDDAINTATWLVYAMAKVAKDDKAKAGEAKSAFRQEYDAWNIALAAGEEMAAKKEAKLTDPQLVMLSDFRKNNQLTAALFLLTYREAYRADFEQWKKDEPDGIARFFQIYNVRP